MVFNKEKHLLISEKSKNVLNVFTSTINQLEALNTQADLEITKRKESIQKLQDEENHLSATKANNENIILKINKILN